MSPLYLALGDSLTTGYGVGFNQAFATLYHRALCRQSPSLSYANEGINGLTVKGLTGLLQANRRTRQQTVQASLITITIGSNDLLAFTQTPPESGQPDLLAAFTHFRRDLTELGDCLRFQNNRARLQIAALYNPLPGGPYQQYSQLAAGILDQANLTLAVWSRNFHAVLVPLDRIIRGREQLLLGPDHFHPSNLGHQAITEAFTG